MKRYLRLGLEQRSFLVPVKIGAWLEDNCKHPNMNTPGTLFFYVFFFFFFFFFLRPHYIGAID